MRQNNYMRTTGQTPRDGEGGPSNVILGSFSAPSGEAPGGPSPPFWIRLDSKHRFISRNGGMLENDDRLYGNATFGMSSGIQHRAKTGAGQLISRSAMDGRLWTVGCGRCRGSYGCPREG